MRRWIFTLLFLSLSTVGHARVVVFWQSGFPTQDSKPISQESLTQALDGMQPVFLGLDDLRKPGVFEDTDLLVLPYGSAFPADAWKALYVAGPLATRENPIEFVLPRARNSAPFVCESGGGIWHRATLL